MIDKYELVIIFRDTSNDFLLWCIQKINKYKDRNLSQRLFEIAEFYNTKPGTRNYDNMEKK